MTTPLTEHARRLAEFADKSESAAKAAPDDWMQQLIAKNQRDAARDAAHDAQEESKQMTTPTLQALEAAEAFIAKARRDLYDCHSRGINGIPEDDLLGLQGLAEIDEVLDKVRAALAAQPELPEPVGTAAELTGSRGGFTHAVFQSASVPVGTLLYTAAQLQQANTESVLVDGTAYATPAPVAAELLRLNIELKQAQAKREPMTESEIAQDMADGLFFEHPTKIVRAIEAHHGIGGKA